MSEFHGKGRGSGGRTNESGRGGFRGGGGGRENSGGARGRGGDGSGARETGSDGGGRGRGFGGRSEHYSGRGGGGGRGDGDGSGRGGRGFDRGGRGGGGRGGGGGGGRFEGFGGRGLSGSNRHMGQISSVVALAAQISDASILAVVDPPMAERNRSALVNNNFHMPSHEPWRLTPAVGRSLDAPHRVRANHFKIDVKNIPNTIVQHHVHIYRVERNNSVNSKEISSTEDPRNTMTLVQKMRERHPEWEALGGNRGLGYTYDGRSCLFTTAELRLPAVNEKGEPYIAEVVGLPDLNGQESTTRRFRVVFTQATVIHTPQTPAQWTNLAPEVIRGLDSSLFAFARNQQVLNNPEWHVVGSKLFNSHSSMFQLANSYFGQKGYFASLKSCLAGAVLVVDMSVNCFLASGDMPELMYKAAGYRDFQAFYRDCSAGPLHQRTIDAINKVIKNCKIKLVHLGHSRKARECGPAADHPDSTFELEGKGRMNVAKYFEHMGRTNQQYRNALQNGKLRYPKLPCINIGSKAKPVLVPPELISVPGGQSRSQCMTPEMTSEMIKIAAVRPDDRMTYITQGENTAHGASVVTVLRSDANARAFGLDAITPEPMLTPATLLPQAKLRYGGERVVDPKLEGTWNMDKPQQKFVRPPPQPARDGSYMFGVLVIGNRPPPENNWQGIVADFTAALIRDAGAAGVRLVQGGNPMNSTDSHDDLTQCLERFKNGGARIVIVLLVSDSYGALKLVGDRMGLATQCCKWKTVVKNPRGFHLNVMLKVNTKLGGTNHTLVSRLPAGNKAPANQPSVFQDPPASLSWLFDQTCMLVGIDVSHAEPGSDKPSMAAVVGSMDGRASQYIAHLSSQTTRQEMVSALEDAMVSLFTAFKARNRGKMPASIVVFRDGVSDGQFNIVLDNELPSIQGALELMGYARESCKVSIVICQKGHHTRLVYEETALDGKTTFINPCPGLVVDARGGANSITSATINEFYLNSHAAIQGTAKPCKYALIYDEIGFKLSELELLTYWTTYLYARCNKSVSYATPAYYAHWASKRGKDLSAAGAMPQDLIDISATWANNALSTMFFI